MNWSKLKFWKNKTKTVSEEELENLRRRVQVLETLSLMKDAEFYNKSAELVNVRQVFLTILTGAAIMNGGNIIIESAVIEFLESSGKTVDIKYDESGNLVINVTELKKGD
jgi:hypothetical protein